jgi:hypothetical protein
MRTNGLSPAVSGEFVFRRRLVFRMSHRVIPVIGVLSADGTRLSCRSSHPFIRHHDRAIDVRRNDTGVTFHLKRILRARNSSCGAKVVIQQTTQPLSAPDSSSRRVDRRRRYD